MLPVLRVRVGTKQWTAQATKGALAYASDGELQLSIADSVVSIAINGQVRERVQTRSAQARPSYAM